MTSNRRGYTLLELIIACSLVMVVLYGLYTTLSSMTNFEVEAVRKSSVNSWSNVSLAVMTKEIEDANVVYFPDSNTLTSNSVMGCSNWSTKIVNPVTNTLGYPVDISAQQTWFYYCLDTTSGPTSPAGGTVNVLRRIALKGTSATSTPAINCPISAVPSSYDCKNTTSLGAGSTNDVIATEVTYANGLTYLFSYNNNASANAVNVNFIVGNPNASGPTPTAGTPSNGRIINPQTATVNTTIQIERPYMDSND